MTQPTPQHLLSRPAQNGSYLTAQAAALLTNLAISINCFYHFAPKNHSPMGSRVKLIQWLGLRGMLGYGRPGSNGI
jgi:hypothetical protein